MPNHKQPIHTISGKGISVAGNDIDTDRIIPARFLKCVTFEALGPHAFEDDRLALKKMGKIHPFDIPEFQGANILFVNKNFGCGSSREHAPQSLQRWGIKAIVGESFAEIFYGNCVSLGIPCVTVSEKVIDTLQAEVEKNPSSVWKLDLNKLVLEGSTSTPVDMKPSVRHQFLDGGWNPMAELLQNEQKIKELANSLPY